MRAHLAIVIGVFGTAVARGAYAQEASSPPAPWLTWRAPDECPDADAMRTSVERLLSRSAGSTLELHASGSVKKQGERFVMQLALTVYRRKLGRTLSAPDCASVSDAAAWLMALAVDPSLPTGAALAPEEPVRKEPSAASDLAAAPAPPNSAELPKTQPAPQPQSTPPKTMAAQRQSDSGAETPVVRPHTASSDAPWRLRLGAFAGVLAAGLAGPAASFGARAGAERADWLFDASFALQPPRSRALRAGATCKFESQELALAGCHVWGETSRLGVCAHAALVWVHGRAFGTSQPSAASFLSGRAGAALVGTQRLTGPVELWLDAHLSAPISPRPKFEVEGFGAVGEMSLLLWAVRAGVGVVVP